MIYFCPTPIGNLEDITLRTIDVLKNVDIIACEDTRVSLKLLNHLNIKKKLISYHKFNEHEMTDKIIEMNKTLDIAIITDAGMPAISDPGFFLIRELIEREVDFEVLPGSTASLLAIIYSGFRTDHYLFYGFLNQKKSERIRELESLKNFPYPIIFYEAPHRILKTLNDMLEVFGDRKISISRELTKLYEEHLRGSLSEIISSDITLKGEFVIVVDGYIRAEKEVDIKFELKRKIDEGMRMSEAIKAVAKEFDLKKNEVYKVSLEDE